MTDDEPSRSTTPSAEYPPGSSAASAVSAPTVDVDQWNFIDALGDGIYGVDTKGLCTFVNGAALAALGFASADELIGRNMHETIHHTHADGSFYPQAACPLLQTLTSGRPVRLENELLWRKDGSPFSAEYSSFPVVKEGAVTGSVITFNDISLREGAQRRLAVQYAVSEVLARSPDLAEAPPQILATIGSGFGWDLGAFWLVEKGSSQLPGTRGRTAGVWRSPALAIPPEVDALFQAALDDGSDSSLPARVLLAGQPISDHPFSEMGLSPLGHASRSGPAAYFAFPLKAGRSAVGVIAFFHRAPMGVDHSLREAVSTLGQQIGQFIRRRWSEGELRQSEALKGAILQSALDCIVTIDQHSRVLEFNPAAERTFGHRREDVVGRDMGDLIVPAEMRERHRLGLARYLAIGVGPLLGKRIEIEALRADGQRFPVELAITPTEVGGVRRFTAYLRDITERRRAEQDLAAARDAAEAANRAKSTFIANMSHELRTPLAAIIGYSDMLIEESQSAAEPADLAHDLRKIQVNAKHLLGLINDVLDLSKIESGKMDVTAEDFDVLALLRDTASTVEPLMARRGNRLVQVLEDDLGTMCSDAAKLRQMLLNLLSNAAKFTASGTVTLSAGRAQSARGENQLVVKIADTGIGMTQEQLDRLFQRFQQADASTTRRFGGSGLGLAITKAFALMLGGDVGVRSAPERGTTFTLTLPTRSPHREEPE